jgi:hypothetical protein
VITAADITSTIDRLIEQYGQKEEVPVIPASSLWLALGGSKAGIGGTNWAGVERAYQKVGGKVLGTDYSPAWLKQHAAELAAAINEEMV